jgi:hypothetical protein
VYWDLTLPTFGDNLYLSFVLGKIQFVFVLIAKLD